MRTGSQNLLGASVAVALALSSVLSLSPVTAANLIADSWTPAETGKQTAATDAAEFTPVHSDFDPHSVSNTSSIGRPGPFQGNSTSAPMPGAGVAPDTNKLNTNPPKADAKPVKTDSKSAATETKSAKADAKSANTSTKPAASNSAKPMSAAKVNNSADLFSAPQKAQTAPVLDKNTPPPTVGSPASGTAAGAQPNQGAPGSAPNSVPGSGTVNANSRNSGPFQGANPPGGDNYPSVGRMERLTFGSATSEAPIEERLSKLETAIFKKASPELSLFDRTQQLKKTLLGNDDEPTADIDNLRIPAIPSWSNLLNGDPLSTQSSSEFDYYGGIAQRPENQQATTLDDMKAFALELINSERAKSGYGPLAPDPIAEKMARDQSQELCQRGIISHSNSKGENPDRRYTVSGGTGALTESIVSNKLESTFAKSPTRASVAELMKNIMSRQDDRDAILNPDATNIGLEINYTPNKDRIIEVAEVITSHGIIPELPNEVGVGEKLEIKGVVAQPYNFSRITVAWEANRALSSASDDADEALPYFPPLDYVAYAQKSSKDYSGAMTALRTAGVIAAIAGGVFIPPVALAAPVIAMSGGMGNGDPKPVSDIPVHGGVHVEGLTFNGRVPINKEGKEGIYYVTIWGSTGTMTKPIPLSRRAIVVKHVDEDVSARLEPSSSSGVRSESNDKSGKKDKSDKKDKHHKNK